MVQDVPPSLSDRFLDKYDVKTHLAKGGFSVVKRCVLKSTDEEFAVKIVRVEDLPPSEFQKVQRESRICRKLQHPNIVQLHDVIQEINHHYLIFELANGGELFEDIVARAFYSEADASRCMQQILEAVNYCHQNGVVHRDIKPENLLLKTKGKGAIVKLADFGLAIEVHGDHRAWFGFSGTPNYMSPELIKKEPYGRGVDIWSCGVVLYILLVGYTPFYHDNTQKLYVQIQSGAYEFSSPEWDSISSEVKELINQMMTLNPDKRITAADALTHPWICNRERVAHVAHRQDTIDSLKKLNARRKFKGAIMTTIFAAKNAVQIVRNVPNVENLEETQLSGNSVNSFSTISEATTASDDSSRREEIINLTKHLIEAIVQGDFYTYKGMCDEQFTAFQPEALGNLVRGLEFHEFYFENVIANQRPKANITTVLNPQVHLLGEDAASIAFIRLTQYVDNEQHVHTHQSEETRVWCKRNGIWKNVHCHQSVNGIGNGKNTQ